MALLLVFSPFVLSQEEVTLCLEKVGRVYGWKNNIALSCKSPSSSKPLTDWRVQLDEFRTNFVVFCQLEFPFPSLLSKSRSEQVFVYMTRLLLMQDVRTQVDTCQVEKVISIIFGLIFENGPRPPISNDCPQQDSGACPGINCSFSNTCPALDKSFSTL